MRSWAYEATTQRVQEINGMHVELLKVKSAEMFGLLKIKHNITTDSFSKEVEERNGFELYRLVCQLVGDIPESAAFHLNNQLLNLSLLPPFNGRCKRPS